MKIETLKSSKRKYFLCFLIVGVVLLITLVLTTSRAKYQMTESIKLAEGTINYKVPDLNLVAMYIESENGDFIETNEVPSDGYFLNESSSYCEVPSDEGEKIKDESITFGYSDGKILIDNLSKKGTKCYLYFDILKTKQVTTSLGNLVVTLNQPNFSKTSCSSGCEEATVGIFEAEDDDGTSYYYRGDVDNNWVKFAGFYWQIVRINGDGSIRIIYTNTSPERHNGGLIINSTFNSKASDNAYMGFMYGTVGASSYSETHANTNNSAIKSDLDTWYQNNLVSYTSYIDNNAGFCNDRSVIYGTGAGTENTDYAGYDNIYYGTPSLKCKNGNDLFTLSDSTKGNKALTYPIGLITADEIVYAGGSENEINQYYYLDIDREFWTMTPEEFYNGWAYMYMVDVSGKIDCWSSNKSFERLRPVINLKADTQFTGTGTSTDPYIVVGAE